MKGDYDKIIVVRVCFIHTESVKETVPNLGAEVLLLYMSTNYRRARVMVGWLRLFHFEN